MITDAQLETARSASPDKDNSLGWRAWLLLLLVSAGTFCFKLGAARSLTEHETWPAGGARQMAADHEWLFPKIGDHLWLEKPPLLHWLIVISAKICGGFSEVSARLPSVVAALGVVILMTELARRWFGARVAIFTALVLTTSVHVITYARLAEAEMLLAFFIVLALFLFARLHGIGGDWPAPPRSLAFWFWIVVGLSNMAKGLGFGACVILSVCLAWLAWSGNRAAWRRSVSWPGMLLGAGIALAWPVAVWKLRAPDAADLWRGTIEQRLGGMYNQPWWYYLTTWAWQLLPWTPALLLAAGPSLKRARHDPASPDRFIWCWTVVPVLLLSLFPGKHHHYIIAPLCALSPLCALGLLRIGTRGAAACLALVLAGILYVDARVMPARDRCREDSDFLRSVRGRIPSGAVLVATDSAEIARHIFYIEPPPQGIWQFADLRRFAGTRFYVVTRRGRETDLQKFGRIQLIAESRHTRKEQTPADRFALFLVEPSAASGGNF